MMIGTSTYAVLCQRWTVPPSHLVMLSWSSLFLSVNGVPVHLSIYLSVILEMRLKNFGKICLTITSQGLQCFAKSLLHIAFLLLAESHVGGSNFWRLPRWFQQGL